MLILYEDNMNLLSSKPQLMINYRGKISPITFVHVFIKALSQLKQPSPKLPVGANSTSADGSFDSEGAGLATKSA